MPLLNLPLEILLRIFGLLVNNDKLRLADGQEYGLSLRLVCSE